MSGEPAVRADRPGRGAETTGTAGAVGTGTGWRAAIAGPARLVRRFARDASGRALLAFGVGVLVSLPLLPVLRTTSTTDPGVAGVAAAMEPAFSLSLALGAVLLAAGSVAEPLRRGWCRTALSRPTWRPGWFLARAAGALAWAPLCAVALHAVLDLLSGPGPLADWLPGAVPGALAWIAAAGAPTFAFSCLLRRGDGLAAAALLLLPALLASLEEGPIHGALAAVAPPVGAAREITEAGLAGIAPDPGAVAEPLAHGSAWLVLGLVVLSIRPLTRE